MKTSDILGTEKIKSLIFNLGWPAALNFLVITIYNLTDVIFVGRWLGPLHIAAVVVVGTIIMIFASFGLAIGVGGSSIIARALGEKDKIKASYVLANQTILVIIISLLIVLFGWLFKDAILKLFGANGDILPYANSYYIILLLGVPFFSLSMMGNNVIHTQGKAKVAMFNSLIPTLVNIILNPILIKLFDMGIEGAAWATLTGYLLGFLLVIIFFMSSKNEIKITRSFMRFKAKIAKEIGIIGMNVLINIVAGNLFIVLVNQILFKYNQETGIVVFAILSRLNMLFAIPIVGIDGGVRPIIGYNFGRQQMDRVRDTIRSGIRYGMAISFLVFLAIFLSADYLVYIFTSDNKIIAEAPLAMRIVFLCSPLFIVQAVAEGYFQAIGKPKTSFYLIILRNVILLVPLLYILSYFFGYYGVLYTFPAVEILSVFPSIWLLKKEFLLKRL